MHRLEVARSTLRSDTTLVVEGTRATLRITVERGLAGGCSGSDVAYDSVLEFEAGVQIENVEIVLNSGR